MELLRSNSVVRVERRGDAWAMELPVKYPAQTTAVKAFLDALGKLTPTAWISGAQIGAAGGTNSLDAFGLGDGALTVKLEMAGSPVLLKLGGLAPVGDQFYLQRVGAEGVFTAPAAFTRPCHARRTTGGISDCLTCAASPTTGSKSAARRRVSRPRRMRREPGG